MDCRIMWLSEYIDASGKDIRTDSYGNKPNNHIIATELKAIWKEGFPDTDDYIDLFMLNRFDTEHTLIAECDGHIVGAGYMLPAVIIMKEGTMPALFGYALGILKQYRGRGITGKMHEYMLHYCDKNNYVFLFHPANEKLSAYYLKTGITDTGYIKIVEFIYDSPPKGQGLPLLNITSEEYRKLRDGLFQKEGYVKWDEAAVDYAVKERLYCGGICKKLIYEDKECAVFGRITKGRLIIDEAVAPDSLLPGIIRELAAYYKTLSVITYLPSDSTACGTVVPWIMGYGMKSLNKVYCNLLLN